MERFLVANITTFENIKTLIENSLKCLYSLGYFFNKKN